MKIVILFGGLAGLIGSVLMLGPTISPGMSMPWVSGPAAAALAGAGLAWVGLRAAERRLVERLSTILDPAGESPSGLRLELGRRGGIDGLVVSMGQALYRLGRANAELRELEQRARSALAAEGTATEPPPSAAGRTSIAGVLDEIAWTTERLLRIGDRVVDLNEQAIRSAADQHDAVSPAAALGEQLCGETERIAQDAGAILELNEQGRQAAAHGMERIRQAIQGMARLRAFAESNGRKVRRHADRSVEIGAIAELIVSISRRTDTLALNATIESVRAGEHGRGFAVVAEEIRKLAERTADAVREIGALVEAIQAETHDSLRALEEEQVEVGLEMERLAEARSALEQLTEATQRSGRIVEGIAQTAGEQVDAAQEINRAVEGASQSTRAAYSRSVQVREQVRALASQTERLRRLAGLDNSARPLPLEAGAGSRAAGAYERRSAAAESPSC